MARMAATAARKWVNEMMGHSLNLLGGSVYFWKLKHNVNHHTFTNVEGMDDDIDIKPWVRVHEGQPKHWFHRFQHIYGLLLYGLTYLFWIFYNDLKKYFTGKIARQHADETDDREGAHHLLGDQGGLRRGVPRVAHVLRRRGSHAWWATV